MGDVLGQDIPRLRVGTRCAALWSVRDRKRGGRHRISSTRGPVQRRREPAAARGFYAEAWLWLRASCATSCSGRPTRASPLAARDGNRTWPKEGTICRTVSIARKRKTMAKAASSSVRRSQGRVLVVDDVITDGGAKRESIELIRAHGANPVGGAHCVRSDGARAGRALGGAGADARLPGFRSSPSPISRICSPSLRRGG